MRTKSVIMTLLAAAAVSASSAAGGGKSEQARYKEDWEDLNRYPQAEWLNELKFGMYFHWNYNTIGGNDGWYGRSMYDPKEKKCFNYHKETFGDQSEFGYKDFAPMFTAEKFSAKEWVDNIERTGGKFVVGMAVHHDGFDMYDSSFTEWNSVDKPPHIDVMGELAKEARRRDMKFGATTHLAWNWNYFSKNLYPDKYDAKEAPELYNIHDPEKGPSPQFVQEWYNRTSELIDKYELDFLWFDFGTGDKAYRQGFTRKLTAYYYNKSLDWGKQVAMASKVGFENEVSKVHDCEQGKFGYIRYPQWMSDSSMNAGWFYIGERSMGSSIATGKYWLDQLVDIVSKNGTLLLNLGPKADGSWPESFKKELFRMGDWLHVNGEAIYYTRPWHRYGEGPTHDGDASHYVLGRSLTAKDIRFTRSGDTLYATVCGYTPDKIDIRSLGKSDIGNIKIKKISCLGVDAKVDWTLNDDALTLSIPSSASKEEFAYTFKIEGKGLCPERPCEYNILSTDKSIVKGVKRIRLALKGKGALAISEVVAISQKHAVKGAKYTMSSTDGECVAALVNDGDACGHPNMKSIAKTKVEDNPWLDITLKSVADVSKVDFFVANECVEAFGKSGVLEFYNESGKLIKSVDFNR